MPVHLFGRPAPLAELAGFGLPIIEDAAQAFGSPEHSGHGDRLDLQLLSDEEPVRRSATAASSPCGTTELAERIRMLRFHGSKAKKTFEYVGYNSRLDEIQAAALRIFLRELDGWTAARREAAARYAELGLGELCEIPVDEPGHVYHLFVCRSPERDRIRAALTEAQIGNASTTCRHSTSSPRCGISATRAGRSRRPSAPRRRTSPFRSGPASPPSSRSGSSTSFAQPSAWRRRGENPV